MDRKKWLCHTCDFSGSCIQESKSESPISFCDEFFIEEPHKDSTVIDIFVSDEEVSYSGLCSTCDHREYCSLRDEIKLIINCEHYQ